MLKEIKNTRKKVSILMCKILFYSNITVFDIFAQPTYMFVLQNSMFSPSTLR